jgi:Uma2 family endonuclease
MWWDKEQLRKVVEREEYLRLERQNEFWSEYIDGVMVEMPSSNVDHCAIRTDLTTELGIFMKNSANFLLGKMRVCINENNYRYPDLLIAGEDLQLEDEYKDSLLNPQLIIEIFSLSTEAYDRGDKFAAYRELESFTEYLSVSQTQPLVEQYIKQADESWKFYAHQGLDKSVRLEAVNCTLALKNIYRRVKFETSQG